MLLFEKKIRTRTYTLESKTVEYSDSGFIRLTDSGLARYTSNFIRNEIYICINKFFFPTEYNRYNIYKWSSSREIPNGRLDLGKWLCCNVLRIRQTGERRSGRWWRWRGRRRVGKNLIVREQFELILWLYVECHV